MNLKEPMPELSGAAIWLNGKVSKNDLIGDKPTLIHFWSVSCRICKEAMRDINQFRDAYADQLNVVAVHMPRSENDLNLEKIKLTAAEQGMVHPVFLDNQHQLTDAFENRYVPAYYVFDKKGLLHHFQAGSSGIKVLEKNISLLLNETKKHQS